MSSIFYMYNFFDLTYKRLELCDTTNYEASKHHSIKSFFDDQETKLVIEFILIILTPFVCLVGLITNSLVVIVVSRKENQKELKENQYKYMRINSLINCLILVIQMINMIGECQAVNGLFCSSVRRWAFSQYFKIVFGEFLSSFLRLMSNLTYIGFSINRLSLIGREHGKLVTYMSKLKVRGFLCRVFFPCLCLSVVKIFRFHPNFNLPDHDYPQPFSFWFNKIDINLIYLYLSFNFTYDLINSVVLLLITSIIDIILIIAFRKTLTEKKMKLSRLKNSKEETLDG